MASLVEYTAAIGERGHEANVNAPAHGVCPTRPGVLKERLEYLALRFRDLLGIG